MPAFASEQGGSHRRGGASSPQTSGEIRRTVKKFALKTFTREQWLAIDKNVLEDQLEGLDRNLHWCCIPMSGALFRLCGACKLKERWAFLYIFAPVSPLSGSGSFHGKKTF
jgi:hypothetical protein